MSDKAVTAALAAAPAFRNLPPRDLSRLAAFCTYLPLASGEVLFREGEEAALFYVVASGRLKVFKHSAEGRELIIKVMGPGDLVGEAAALAGVPYPASAQALEKAAAVQVPRADFVRALTSDPELALNIIAALSARLHQLSGVIEKLTLKEVPARLASYLLEHARPDERGRPAVELGVTKAALAAELGTVPETLSRAFRRLTEAGLLAEEGPRLLLPDPDALRLLSGAPD
jgi:CRP/FNR family transcriptional regulator